MKEFLYVRLLKNIGKEDTLLAGGKGANLGEMIKAGLPVPEGFVVLVDSYKRFVEENGLHKEITNMLDPMQDNIEPESIKDATEKLQDLFIRGKIPGQIRKEIDQLYEEMSEASVAVRSSATAEDMPGASFAGQYTTFLNVKGKDELYLSIKRCWASLWNSRAVSYRTKQNIGNTDLAHGVVVQQLIHSEKSGILFTANPVNGRRDEVSLNSSWGLGEAIVSGDVDPDQWIINKKNKKIVYEYIASKKVKTVRKAHGIDLVPVEAEKQESVTLNESERKTLMDLARKVEDYYGAPQDIEWAYELGKFFLVQTKPITSLYPMPKPGHHGEDLRLYMNLMMYRQGMSAPITPAGVSFFMSALSIMLVKRKYRDKSVWWLKSAGGRIFVDITEFLKIEAVLKRLRSGNIPNMMDTEPITLKALGQIADRDRAELMKNKKSILRLLLGISSRMNPRLIGFKASTRPREMYGKLAPYKSVERAIRYGTQQIHQLKKRAKGLKTVNEKLAFVERESATVFFTIGYGMIYWLLEPITSIDRATKIIDKYRSPKRKNKNIQITEAAFYSKELKKVKRAVPGCVTTEMGMEMLNIAKKLDQKGEQASCNHSEIMWLIEKYGHRSLEEIDIGDIRPEEGNVLKKGEILVTASTNPAWTPLFLKIGGLVMETGAPMSHGPVVAREYGIPAVIGVKEATIRLVDGQRIRINGQTGTVEVLEETVKY